MKTTPYHPECNGQVERINQTLFNAISMYTAKHQEDWDLYVPGFCFAYNTSIHAAINENPYFMPFGRDAPLPVDTTLLPANEEVSIQTYKGEILNNLRIAHEQGRYFIQKAAQKMKHTYDLKAQDTKFCEGDKVYIHNPPTTTKERQLNKKLQHTYHGPYHLGEKTYPVNFRLLTIDGTPTGQYAHVNRLERYVDMLEGPDYLQPDYLPITEEEASQPEAHEIPGIIYEQDQLHRTVAQENEPNENEDTIAENPQTTNEGTDNINQENQNVFQAEYIVKHRNRNGITQYLVHWAPPYDSIKDRSWEPSQNILDPELLHEYTTSCEEKLAKSRQVKGKKSTHTEIQ